MHKHVYRFMKQEITVKVMLYSGLDKEVQIQGYDPYKGILINMPINARLRNLVALLSFKDKYSVAYFINGNKAGMWQALKDNDKIECIKPVAGG